MTSPFSQRDIARAAILALVATAIWLVCEGLWHHVGWRSPPNYRIDALESLARIKLAADEGLATLTNRTMPRLGAPFGADWHAYPLPDAPVFWMLGIVERMRGIAVAGHVAEWFAHTTSVLSFYVCSRLLGHRWVVAAAAALLFGFSYFNATRGLSHYSFALSFVVPTTLVTSWVIGCGRTMLERPAVRGSFVVMAALTASGSPYYGLMFVTLVTVAIGCRTLTQGLDRGVGLGLACLVTWALVFVSLHHQALAAMLEERGVLVRNYADTDRLGLRPIEWFLPPPGHRLPGASSLVDFYTRALPARGENTSSYFGAAGILGLGLVVFAFVRALLHRRAGARPAHAPTILLVTGMWMVGGGGALIALLATELFRAGNRYSIFVLATCLLALSAWASRRLAQTRIVVAATLAALATALGLWDQLPPIPGPAELKARSLAVELDRRMGPELEAALQPGAMVFQLPVVPFLEQPKTHEMTDYEHLRPFLATRTLRFSYGVLAGDPALIWQRRVAQLPFVAMREELENAGFAALCIHRSGYADGGAHLRESAVAAGLPILFDAAPHLVFGLRPAASPTMPTLEGPNRYQTWNGASWNAAGPTVLAAHGWYDPESNKTSVWRWTTREAEVVLWNPHDRVRKVRVTLSLSSSADGQLEVLLPDGGLIWGGVVLRRTSPHVFLLDLPPGEMRLLCRFRGAVAFGGPSDTRQLGFRLIDPVITVID